eukprot:TRINITY_DN3674_c0_g1_i1.p4 TRINITY_DN3674_c0_g1~~TRINITY_DN3674_c0_g1_i1.p4  ORF type:complete len:178 (+),score=53.71 TRINITY_DN3674_c0_g1_i1:318-851(+)
MTKISFSIALDTTGGTCGDMAVGSQMYIAMQQAGATLAGGVSKDAVKVVCSGGRRLRSLGRRLATLNIDFEVTVPTTEAAAAKTAVEGVTLAAATAAFTQAATDAGASGVTFTVTEASLTALKASVTSVEVTPAGGANTTTTTTTAAANEPTESSAAADMKSLTCSMVAALLLIVSL